MSNVNESSPITTPVQGLTNSDQTTFLHDILSNPGNCSIVPLDLLGNILAWNEGDHLIYGYTEAEVVGSKTALFLHIPGEVESGKAASVLVEALRTGRWVGNLQRIRKDGKTFTAHVTVTLRRSETGAALGFTMISTVLGASLRALLHHEGARKGNRIRLVHRIRHRSAERRKHRCHQRGRTGNDFQDVLSYKYPGALIGTNKVARSGVVSRQRNRPIGGRRRNDAQFRHARP